MSRVVTTTVAADTDIRAIATYIAGDKPQSARDFGVELAQAFIQISEHADIGRFIDIGLPITLQVVRVSRRFRRYLVFYRVLERGADRGGARAPRGARREHASFGALLNGSDIGRSGEI
jgi:plasmid stabilization system protein ParE